MTVNRVLIAWDGYALVWLGFSWGRIVRSSPERTRLWALSTDENRTLTERLVPGRRIRSTLVVVVSLLGFACVAFTLGTSLAASDVTVETRTVRRIVLAHSLLAFLYNTAIVALVVNIALAIG